jgi:hypothetical protein
MKLLCSTSFVGAIAAVALEKKLLIVTKEPGRYELAKNLVDDFAKVATSFGLILGENFFVTREENGVMRLIIAGERNVQKAIEEVYRRGVAIADMPVFKNRDGLFTASFSKMEFMYALRHGIAQTKQLDPKRVTFAKLIDSAWVAKVSTLAAVSDTPAMRDLLKAA